MRLTLLAASLVLATLAGCASTGGAGSSDVRAVLANPARSQADRERDLRDRPDQVLALARFKRGDTVADILSGGGYYAEILSGIVGPRGKVLLVNNPGYEAFGRKGLAERLAGDRLPNVTHLSGPTEALGMGEGVLDGAVIVMSYHDLYWVDEKEGWPKVDAGQFLDQVVRALKPGGVLLVVDHSAKAGTSTNIAPPRLPMKRSPTAAASRCRPCGSTSSRRFRRVQVQAGRPSQTKAPSTRPARTLPISMTIMRFSSPGSTCAVGVLPSAPRRSASSTSTLIVRYRRSGST